MSKPHLKALAGGSARAVYLEGLRSEKGWSYQRIADEINARYGVRRTVPAVRAVIQGQADGLKTWRGETPLLVLIAGVLDADPERVEQSHLFDVSQRGLALDWTSKGYFPQWQVDLRILEAAHAARRQKRTHRALSLAL